MSCNKQKNIPAADDGGALILHKLKGFLFTAVFFLLLLIPLSLMCRAIYAKKPVIDMCGIAAVCLSALFFGFYISKSAAKSGILYGAAAGVLFFAALFICSFAAGGDAPGVPALFKLGAALIGGAIGGIAGINTKKPVRRR